MAVLPGRTGVAPLIESDYCYLLIAADRLYEGLGPTAPLPVAPGQPWSWDADWVFLTRWPVGYPLLICAVRGLFGLATLDACRWISLVACAAALVGWFEWVRRIVPNRWSVMLAAAVAAGCAVSVSGLVNPSTDMLLVAAIPYLLLLTMRATSDRRGLATGSVRQSGGGSCSLVTLGLVSGGLFWIRYASVFVPVAIGVYLLIAWWRRRAIRLRHVLLYGVCAAVPMVALLAVNHIFGPAESMQGQLNLGQTVSRRFSTELIARAWWNFTEFGFYAHHELSRWITAVWPGVLLLAVLAMGAVRRAARSFLARPEVALSVAVTATLLAMLIGSTALFGDKYDYVGLDRYYLPLKPLYFALFICPLLLVRQRTIGWSVCVAMAIAGTWIVQQDWARSYRQNLAADRVATPYGQWSRCFGSNAGALFGWLREQDSNRLIVVSNFHEYIALETGIPALPIPPDRGILNGWIERIADARGVRNPRVWFVLDPSNRWRDYWIRPPAVILRDFDLVRPVPGAERFDAQVLVYPTSS